jgi:hypothetical protein
MERGVVGSAGALAATGAARPRALKHNRRKPTIAIRFVTVEFRLKSWDSASNVLTFARTVAALVLSVLSSSFSAPRRSAGGTFRRI